MGSTPGMLRNVLLVQYRAPAMVLLVLVHVVVLVHIVLLVVALVPESMFSFAELDAL